MTVSAHLLPLTVDPIPLQFPILTSDPLPPTLVHLPHLLRTIQNLPLELTVHNLHHITTLHHHHHSTIFLHQTRTLWQMIFIPHLLQISPLHLHQTTQSPHLLNMVHPPLSMVHRPLGMVHPLLSMVHPPKFLFRLTSFPLSCPHVSSTFFRQYFPQNLFHETLFPPPLLPPPTFPPFLEPQ